MESTALELLEEKVFNYNKIDCLRIRIQLSNMLARIIFTLRALNQCIPNCWKYEAE